MEERERSFKASLCGFTPLHTQRVGARHPKVKPTNEPSAFWIEWLARFRDKAVTRPASSTSVREAHEP